MADSKRSIALAKAAKGSLNIMSAFICGLSGKPVSCHPPFSKFSESKVALPLLSPAAKQYILHTSRCLACNKNKVHGIKLFSDRLFISRSHRYFQHGDSILIVGVGKSGAYYLVHGDLLRQHPFGTTLRCTGPVPVDSRQ